MKKSTTVTFVAVSLIASSFLVGCGSSSSSDTQSTTSIAGVAIDPELQGATVFLDKNENALLDAGELRTLTDKYGNYSLTIPQSDAGKPLVVLGGVDRVTKEPFLGKMSSVSQAGNNTQNITPFSSLIQQYKQANPTQSIADIKTQLSAKLGLTADDLDKKSTDSPALLKIALRIHRTLQAVAAATHQNSTKIYATLAQQLTSQSDLNAAMDATIAQEVAAGTLDAAKIKDLSTELANVPDTLTIDELALSVDNIKTKIEAVTDESQLSADLASDNTVIVQGDAAVNAEKGKRALKALGLDALDDTIKTKILQDGGLDLDNDSLDEMRKKVDNNDANLTQSERGALKVEQLFNDNGLKNLDPTTKSELKTKLDNENFDFVNATNEDFKKRIDDDALFGGDENLKAKVRGEMNKSELEGVETESLADGKHLIGSLIKGPIDGATVKLKDAAGNLITSSISENGIFVLPSTELTSPYYTLESIGGTYSDEATKSLVEIGMAQGLKTLLTKEELQNILANKQYIAITPETTIYAEVVLNDIQNNSASLSAATTAAKTLITDALIKDSSPMTMLPGDKFLQTGDLTTAFPKEQSEAFARNRTISFSYMVRDLNLSASEVFNVLNLVIDDFKDGSADGIQLADGRDVNVSEAFALSRLKLFNDTTSKLREGKLSDGQKAQLKKMGFDVDRFANKAAQADADLKALVSKYISSTTLPTLHRLPVLSDEDGNTTDAQETYTLAATPDVNVTIETPDGSWITPMWRYNNNPLPVVIKATKGDAMTLNFDNNLSADSTIHWHGFQIPAIMDGGPDMPVAPDTSKVYSFTMSQPAAPLWFHPHPDMQTGKQVYMGLAGVFLLQDSISKDLEANKQLPSGEKDTVLLVQDRRFTDANATSGVKELAYKNMPMDSDGMLGDTILVNGSVVPKQDVNTTLYRYRLYNVSNARNYDFALSDDSNFTVVATDGGLLEKPVTLNHIVLGAAERVEIVIDFSKYSVGDKVMLVSKPFNGDMMGMMGGSNMGDMNGDGSNMGNGDTNGGDSNMNGGDSNMGGGDSNMGGNDANNSNMQGSLPNGAGLAIMRFDVNASEPEDVTLYSQLPATAAIASRLTEANADNQGNAREFLMSMGKGMGQGMSFVINGKTFDINRVDEYVPAGATEVWSIKNMSPMAHPFHAHAIQYQILSRNGVPASGTDLGWKDTFLVQPGETVKVIGDFSSATGDYMYHCHILEHEDAGMMGYFRVGDTGNVGN